MMDFFSVFETEGSDSAVAEITVWSSLWVGM